MQINESLIQFALWFIPGVICAGVVDRLTTHHDRSVSEFLIRSFVFGLACYVLYFVLRVLWPFDSNADLAFSWTTEVSADLMRRLRIGDVAWAVVISFVLGMLWSFAANRKLLIRPMQWLGITRRYGDEDVWDFTFNLGTPNVEYAYVRDFDKRIVYSGWGRLVL